MSEENQVFTEKRSAMLQRTAEYLAVTRRVRNQKVTLVIGRIIAWGLLVGVAALTSVAMYLTSTSWNINNLIPLMHQ